LDYASEGNLQKLAQQHSCQRRWYIGPVNRYLSLEAIEPFKILYQKPCSGLWQQQQQQQEAEPTSSWIRIMIPGIFQRKQPIQRLNSSSMGIHRSRLPFLESLT
jgi:hypothetical protein